VRFPADPGSPRPEQFLAVNPRPGDGHHVVLDVVGHVDAFTAPLLRACLRRTGLRWSIRRVSCDHENTFSSEVVIRGLVGQALFVLCSILLSGVECARD
jgi:hypothetical protein